MRHLLASLVLISSSFAFASTELCYESSKELYMEIQVYKETHKIQPAKAVVGSRLEFDLSLLNPKSTLSTSDKVSSLETAFAKCDVNLTEEEKSTLKQNIEEAKQSIN